QQLAVLVELEDLMSLGRTSGRAHRSGRSATGSRCAPATSTGSSSCRSGTTAGTTGCTARTGRCCATGGPAALAGTAVVAIGHPCVFVAVNEQAMREHDDPGAEALNQLAVFVEVQDRIEIRHLPRRRVVAAVCAAAIEDPHRFAIAIDVDSGGRAPF